MSYGSSRQEKIRELPGLIAAASGALVRAKVAEADAQRTLDAALAKDLALAPPEKESDG